MSSPFSPPPPSPGGYPPPGSSPYPPPAAPAGRSGLAIVGFVLAILVAPIGLIISVVALILAAKRRQKGKVLASLGIVVALILTSALAYYGKNILTVLDPGCQKARDISEQADKIEQVTDKAQFTTQLGQIITGLDAAAAQAEHANVRTALTTFNDDFRLILKAVETGDASLMANLQGKIAADGDAVDDLCTIGGSGR